MKHFLRFKDVKGQPEFLQVVSDEMDEVYETTVIDRQSVNQALALPPMVDNEFSNKIREKLKAISARYLEIEFDPFDFLQQICKAFPEQVPYISLEASTTPDNPETGRQLSTGGFLVTEGDCSRP